MYIATQLIGREEKEELRTAFTALDTNADGKLSREELMTGYTRICGNKDIAEQEVEQIMDKVDIDHNGFIEYSGAAGHESNANRVPPGIHQQKEAALQGEPQAHLPALRPGNSCCVYR